MSKSIVFVVANKKSYRGGVDEAILFPDCTMSIEHTFENDVTEHPIDGKASVSDHVVTKNMKMKISGIYNTHNIQTYIGDSISSENRVAKAYTELLRLRNDKEKFTIVSRYDVYNNMVIKSLTIPVAPDNGNALIFEMDLVQVRVSEPFSTVRLVQLEDISEPVVDAAAVKTQQGSVQKAKTSSPASIKQVENVINGGGRP